MLHLSDILSSAAKFKHRNVIENASTVDSLSTFANSSFNNDDRFSEINKSLRSIENNLTVVDVFDKTQKVVALQDDKNLADFVFILDCISAFSTTAEVFFTDEKKNSDWYATQVKNKLVSINKFVDQLAACITIYHEDVKTELNMDVNIFDSTKTLSTIIKQFPEYKQFKKLSKKRIDFSNQSLNIRSLATIIMLKTKELLTIL